MCMRVYALSSAILGSGTASGDSQSGISILELHLSAAVATPTS